MSIGDVLLAAFFTFVFGAMCLMTLLSLTSEGRKVLYNLNVDIDKAMGRESRITELSRYKEWKEQTIIKGLWALFVLIVILFCSIFGLLGRVFGDG